MKVLSPLFDWLQQRAAGVLLHPTALPGNTGIGTLGRGAQAFIDLLHEAGMTYWQMCPLGPTGYGDSPYQSFSAFAGNPYLIDLGLLVEAHYLHEHELQPLRGLGESEVDFGLQWERRWPILQTAADRFLSLVSGNALVTHETEKAHCASFHNYCKTNAEWLEPYVLYSALKRHNGNKSWFDWPREQRSYASASKQSHHPDVAAEVARQRVYQYWFAQQWQQLRAYAAEKAVQIVGDIPIFVSLDSADTWSHPELYELNAAGKPAAVAGVPPDYFSPLGQLWGNPLYRWDKHAEDNYAWWQQRLRHAFALYDVVRIDHFRGFDTYWRIPAKEKDARRGKWIKGPGLKFFEMIRKAFPHCRLIAEDLGLLSQSVRDLRAASGLPGMAILQFAFDDPDSTYLPHNLSQNSVLYPGTHDNNTSLGWYESAPAQTRDHMRRYLGVSGDNTPWDFIRCGYASVSRLFVVPLQDLLSLDATARFNTPGEPAGNWKWRVSHAQLERLREESTQYLRDLKDLYRR